MFKNNDSHIVVMDSELFEGLINLANHGTRNVEDRELLATALRHVRKFNPHLQDAPSVADVPQQVNQSEARLRKQSERKLQRILSQRADKTFYVKSREGQFAPIKILEKEPGDGLWLRAIYTETQRPLVVSVNRVVESTHI